MPIFEYTKNPRTIIASEDFYGYYMSDYQFTLKRILPFTR